MLGSRGGLLSNLSGRSSPCIHSGSGGASWHSRRTDLRAPQGAACPAPSSSFHQCASSSSVTREPCRHLSSSRAASPSRQVRSCFSNSPNSLRFSRSSCLLRNQPAVESALSATPWCIHRSEKVRRECSWSHPFHSLTTFSRNPKSRSGKVGQGCILAHRCSGHDQTLGRVRA